MNINKTQIMYDQIAPVNHLNSVPGFDPRRYLRKTVTETGQELLVLDLKYRKLWFRLKYPAGRIITMPLKVTEELAVFETKVYFDGTASEPNVTNTATRYAKGKFAALYIQNAQNASVGEALSDAGFGLQFCDVSANGDIESTGGEVKQPAQPQAAVKPVASPKAPKPASVTAQAVTEKVIASDKVPEKKENTAVPHLVEIPPVTQEVPSATQENTTVAEQSADTPAVTETKHEAAEPVISEKTAAKLPVAVQTTEPEEIAVVPAADNTAINPESHVATETSVSRFTPDMPVEEILNGITPEEAEAIVVDFGLCKGMTLAEVAEKRLPSLKFFSTGYAGNNNLVRAGAQIVYSMLVSKAA